MAIIPASADLRSIKTKRKEQIMRVAILVLGIIGSVMAISFAACAGTVAGAMGGMSDFAEEVAEQAEAEGLANELVENTDLTEEETEEIKDTYNTGKNEFDAVTGSVANSAMLAGAQGVLGLIGCIIAFIALGKGNKAVVGGILLTLAVVASLWALEFSGVGISTILHLIAAIMAFVAAPKVMAEA